MPVPIRQSAPKIQQVRGPKSASEYLKELDTLLKRNSGQGLFVGQDVSSNSPMYIPGKVSDPSGIGSVAPSVSQYGNGMTQPTPVQREAPYQPDQPDQSNQQAVSIEDFLQAFNQVYNAPENQPPVSGVPSGIDTNQGIASSPDGGIIYRDGSIHYEDGTMRVGDPNAYGIASEGPGKIRYSDGSIRQAEAYGMSSRGQTPEGRDLIGYSDNSTRYGQYQYGDSQPVDMPGGLSGLVSGIFGQNRPITQAYGNVNPIEPTRGHVNLGTDVRTRDIPTEDRGYKLPVGATVVQVYQDDGTRFGTTSGHKGYGNSILVQLPTGEMLRFSHMSQMADVKPGDTITAGQVFGLPGATGNATGEHLDLEYYNSQGQIDNPVNFSGFTDPQGLRSPLPNQPAPGTRFETPQTSQTPASDIAQSITQAPKEAYNAVAPVVASGINKLNPTGQIGLGVTETLQGNPEAARAEQVNSISSLGTALNAPDLNTKALSEIQGTNPFRQLAGNLVDYASTPLKKLGLPDTGFSEALAGGKTLNTDASLVPQTYAAGEMLSKPKTPQDYAGVLGQNIKDVGSTLRKDAGEVLNQAGQGVKNLGQAGVDALGNVFKPPVAKRAIGDVSGTVDQTGKFSSLMDSAPSMTTPAKNDVRDPFFKMGGSDLYKSYLKPNAQDLAGGALTLDLFTPDFYKDSGNISSVFGGSKDLGAATDKFVEFERAKYPLMSRMASSPEYDQGSVDSYNQQVDQYNSSINNYLNSVKSSTQGAQSIFTPLPTAAKKNVFSASTPVQMSSIPTQMSSSMSAPSLTTPTAPKPIPVPTPTPSQSFSSPSSNSGGSSQMSSSPSSPSVSASRPTPTPVPTPARVSAPAKVSTPAPKPTVSAPKPTPVPTPTKSPAPQSQPTSNVFSKIVSAIKNIFRR